MILFSAVMAGMLAAAAAETAGSGGWGCGFTGDNRPGYGAHRGWRSAPSFFMRRPIRPMTTSSNSP